MQMAFTLSQPDHAMPKGFLFLIALLSGASLFTQAQTSNLILTGLYDGPLGTAPRGVELYVANDIADLSEYGLGSANNGGGSDGEEFTFPAVSATAGDFIYVTNDAVEFSNFFGFAADYEDGVSGINGDDAFEVFFLGNVVDIFGLINVDGTGEPWEWTDGWAYRATCTGPDGDVFSISNWLFSGINVFDGTTTNATAPTPFPLASYDPVCPSGTAADIVITEIMYNSPQLSDIEFIELYNNESSPVDLTGYRFVSGIIDTLPSIIINPGEYVVLTDEMPGFTASYGFAADHQWVSGVLSNSGEPIILQDTAGLTVDVVIYSDASPWPNNADGLGTSLTLCDVDDDNDDPDNWRRSYTNAGFLEDGIAVYASPGTGEPCIDDPIVSLVQASATYTENEGTVAIALMIANPDGDPTSVDVDVITGLSSADGGGTDYTFTSTTVTFPSSTDTIQTFDFTLVDDALSEGPETVYFRLSNPTNFALLATDTLVVTIDDDEAPVDPLDSALVLIGLYHGPLSGEPKGIELLVREDIADLSVYGISTASNGGGSDGIEWSFPAVSATEGEYLYVANDTASFRAFFGFGANFEDFGDACNFNGDDAFELFEDGKAIDVFGEIDVDGTGEDWEYTDSWAKRVPGTGPDGTMFVLNNWNLGPLGTFDGQTTNIGSPSPYPIGANAVGIAPSSNESAVRVFPNPTQGLIVVSSPQAQQMWVHDLSGRELFFARLSAGENRLQLPLEPGIYLARFALSDQALKILVQ